MFEAHIGALATTNLVSIVINPTLSSYLESIFDPIVRWAFGTLKDYQDGLVGEIGTDDIDRVATGSKQSLDQYFQIPGRGHCDFVKSSQGPPFKVFCHVDLKNGSSL
jgi:hypothetical protein